MYKTKTRHMCQMPATEWPWIVLGEVAESQYGLSEKASRHGGTSIVGMQHVQSGRVLLRNLPRVSVSDMIRARFGLCEGDLLFNRTNSAALVGKCGIVPPVRGETIVFASYLVRLSVDRTRILPAFLNYILGSSAGIARLRALATPGVSQYNISPSVLLRRFRFPLPPLSTQASIVSALEAMDDGVGAVARLLDCNRHFNRALIRQLLTGAVRFQGYEQANPVRSTPHGTLPGDWNYPRIRDIAREVRERADDATDIPVLACTKHEGLVDSHSYFGRRVHSKDTSRYWLVRRGEFAFPTNHVEEGSIGLLRARPMGLVSPIYTVFRVTDAVLPEYLYLVLKSDTYRHIFSAATNESVNRRGSLRWREFAQIQVPIPGVDEQRAIADLAVNLQDEITTLQLLAAALDTQKGAILEKLLSGELSLSVT